MAWIGSALILLLVMSLSRKIRNINTILIVGMMLSSAISAVVGILQYVGSEEALKSFVVWTMGSVSTVTIEQIKILVPVVIVGLVLAIVVIKPLNMLLLGEGYARTMGLNVKHSRTIIFLSTTLLAGTVTAFLVSLAVVKALMNYVKRKDFKVFGYYRIILGAVILIYYAVLSRI